MTATKEKIRLLLVDDHGLFREGLGRLLEAESSFELAGEFAAIEGALEMMDREEIDVVLLDFDLGGQTALDFLGQLRTRDFKGSVLIVTAGLSSLDTLRVTELGAKGIFLKHRSPADLIGAIRKVVNGEAWLDPAATEAGTGAAAEQRTRSMELTARELEVLKAVFEGLTNKEIGSKLGISEAYVKALLQQLFSKTGVRSRSQLVRVALEKQVLPRFYQG